MSDMSSDTPAVENGRSPGEIAVYVAGALLILLPAIRMFRIVRGGTVAQYADYWMMVPSIFESSGWPNWSGLFELRNEHPIVIGKILYWFNYKLTGGSNISLGYVILFIAILQVVIIALLIRRNRELPTWAMVAVTVVFASICFSRQGTWNFAKSMSGAAWLSATLFVLAAILPERMKSRSASLIFGVLASLSYGTGLMVWPALIITGLVRDRRPKAHWRPALVGVAVYAAYLAAKSAGPKGSTLPSTIAEQFKNSCLVLGSAIGGPNTAVSTWVAIATVVLGGIFGVIAIRANNESAAPWIGIYTWGVITALLIGTGRNSFVAIFTASRYYSVGLLCITAVVALMFLSLNSLQPRIEGRRQLLLGVSAIVPLCIFIGTWLSGGGVVTSITSVKVNDELLGPALLSNAAHGSTQWTILEKMPPIEGLLKDIGHYPFDGRSNYACNRIGTTLTKDEVVETQHASDKSVYLTSKQKFIPNGKLLAGRTYKRPFCLAVTDNHRRVIGAGVWGEANNKGAEVNQFRIVAVAPIQPDGYRLYIRYTDSDRFYRIRKPTFAGGAK